MPTNSIITIHKQTVMVHPIIDKYYERDPHHVRSSAFVQAKGLSSNEKPPSGPISPAIDRQQSELDGYRKMMGGTAPFGSSRSLSPDLTRRSGTPAAMSCSSQLSQTCETAAPRTMPAQGNIKVKRRSAHPEAGQQHSGGALGAGHASDLDERAQAEIRSSRKLSQYFPELNLAPEAIQAQVG